MSYSALHKSLPQNNLTLPNLQARSPSLNPRMSWSNIVAQNPQPAPDAIRPDAIRCALAWYIEPPAADRAFIEAESAKLASRYRCDRICIRSDIHDTSFAADSPIGPQGSRVKVIIRAEFHFTVDFRVKKTGLWLSAHVYTKTRRVIIAAAEPNVYQDCYSGSYRYHDAAAAAATPPAFKTVTDTDGLAPVDGKRIVKNPEVWHGINHTEKETVLQHYVWV